MASLMKLVYVLVVLSIAADLINLSGYWFEQNGHEISMHSSPFLPGANGAILRLAKSAIKAAKKKEKNQRRVEGEARKKAKKAEGDSGK